MGQVVAASTAATAWAYAPIARKSTLEARRSSVRRTLPFLASTTGYSTAASDSAKDAAALAFASARRVGVASKEF